MPLSFADNLPKLGLGTSTNVRLGAVAEVETLLIQTRSASTLACLSIVLLLWLCVTDAHVAVLVWGYRAITESVTTLLAPF